MIPRPYQLEKAAEAFLSLSADNLVYLAMQERTGKTLTSIVLMEMSKYKKVLVITKRKAVEGWEKTLAAYQSTIDIKVTTYQQAYKFEDFKPDAIALDECHNYISAFPGRRHNKPTKLYTQIKTLTKGLPLIYMSATPHAQGYQMLYNQLALSSWSPFSETNPYAWFETYGIPETDWVNDREVNVYKQTKEDLIRAKVDKYFVTGTRAELGFEHEPEDKLHYVTLGDTATTVYNFLMSKKVLNIQGLQQVADSGSRLRSMLHMLEGGSIKLTNIPKAQYKPDEFKLPHKVLAKDEVVDLLVDIPGINEKVDFILDTWGDTKDLVIFYNYMSEKFKLERNFEHATIAQATAFAEGVDFTHIEHMVIYSQDFSTARHTQRRARQASQHRDSEIVINYLLVADGVSEQVYETVSVNKVNFVDSVFERKYL